MRFLVLLFTAMILASCIDSGSIKRNDRPFAPESPKPTPTVVKTVEPSSEPTSVISTRIVDRFKNISSCETNLTPSHPSDYIATLKCDRSSYNEYSRIHWLHRDLEAINTDIEALLPRKDFRGVEAEMVYAIKEAINGPFSELHAYFKKQKRDDKLVKDFKDELGCSDIRNSNVRYFCPLESIEKLENAFIKYFANVNLEATRISFVKDEYFYQKYHPRADRQMLLEELSKIQKATYTETFTYETGSKPNQKVTTIAFWMAMKFESLLDRYTLENPDTDRKVFSAEEIKTIFTNIKFLAENGNDLVKELHEVQKSNWLDVRFTTAEPNRQVQPTGGRFFVRMNQPITKDLLKAEAQFINQFSQDLTSAFDNANTLYPEEVKFWLDNYGWEDMDGSDYLYGSLHPKNAMEMIATIKKFKNYLQDFEEIRNLTNAKGKKLYIQIAVTSSLETKLNIESYNYLGDPNVLGISFKVTRQANWHQVMVQLKKAVEAALSK